jgi:hypothetical protein
MIIGDKFRKYLKKYRDDKKKKVSRGLNLDLDS